MPVNQRFLLPAGSVNQAKAWRFDIPAASGSCMQSSSSPYYSRHG
ncbi:hypothetical protein HMPREF0201_00373 [Cedecea davisae DSM 4568]|uniref:Uncharacterized protein n=1 Tax=Cedecea davisae DSM 4568 TaxID=566551 RepID=S3JKH8_9ENTR|nr:hypothetical protein HMPREF0201_00373 [Cedecea davisae DSM 4568]